MEENAVMPTELVKRTLDEMGTTRELGYWTRALSTKLGHKGWLSPTLPMTYGVGVLKHDQAVSIAEEMERYDVRPSAGSGTIATPGLYVYGTEEQKQEFLKPILQGEAYGWQAWTEPDA